MSRQPDVREALRRMLDGRPVVITGGPLASLVRHVPDVTELSGHPPFLLAYGIGTGPLPEPGDALVHLLPVGNATSVVGTTHEQLKILADLPADAIAALDAWDPGRRAVVLASPFFTSARSAGARSSAGDDPSGRRSRTRRSPTRCGTTRECHAQRRGWWRRHTTN